MEHNIDPRQHGPRGRHMADAVQACVHCGFCLPACPTYQVLGEEMDSPRGRIYLMKAVLEGELEAADAQPYIDRCLGCVGCVPACPSGVPYGELLLSYRALHEGERRRSPVDAVSRRLVVETLPYPDRFRLAARAGRIGRRAARFLPDTLQAMVSLLPDALPEPQPLPRVVPAVGRRRARVALLTGCVQQVLAPAINWATVRVLAANGVETVVPPGQGCCGAILMHIGAADEALALARRNLAAFDGDFDAIVTNAAGCGSGMKEYGVLFAGEADAGAARAFAGRVRDVVAFLAELGWEAPGALPEPLTVAYQDACHLNHAQGIAAAPRALLEAVPNLTLVALGDDGLCCGSAGTYNIDQPAIAGELGRRKADAIIASGAQAVVSGNIGCLTQIRTHLARRGAAVEALHTMELLDRAYR